MVRVLDNPRAVSSHPPAAKVLTAVSRQTQFRVGTEPSRPSGSGAEADRVRQRLIAITTPDLNNDAGMNFLDVRNVV
jgi:hypothetical protein